jgi:hypothetical protein
MQAEPKPTNHKFTNFHQKYHHQHCTSHRIFTKKITTLILYYAIVQGHLVRIFYKYSCPNIQELYDTISFGSAGVRSFVLTSTSWIRFIHCLTASYKRIPYSSNGSFATISAAGRVKSGPGQPSLLSKPIVVGIPSSFTRADLLQVPAQFIRWSALAYLDGPVESL